MGNQKRGVRIGTKLLPRFSRRSAHPSTPTSTVFSLICSTLDACPPSITFFTTKHPCTSSSSMPRGPASKGMMNSAPLNCGMESAPFGCCGERVSGLDGVLAACPHPTQTYLLCPLLLVTHGMNFDGFEDSRFARDFDLHLSSLLLSLLWLCLGLWWRCRCRSRCLKETRLHREVKVFVGEVVFDKREGNTIAKFFVRCIFALVCREGEPPSSLDFPVRYCFF